MKLRNQSCQLILGHYSSFSSLLLVDSVAKLFHEDQQDVSYLKKLVSYL